MPYRVLTATRIKTGCPESWQWDKDTFVFSPPATLSSHSEGKIKLFNTSSLPLLFINNFLDCYA